MSKKLNVEVPSSVQLGREHTGKLLATTIPHLMPQTPGLKQARKQSCNLASSKNQCLDKASESSSAKKLTSAQECPQASSSPSSHAHLTQPDDYDSDHDWEPGVVFDGLRVIVNEEIDGGEVESSVKKNLSYSYLFPSYPQNKRNKM